MGLVCRSKGEYKEALELFLKTLKIKEAAGDKKALRPAITILLIFIFNAKIKRVHGLSPKSIKITGRNWR